MDSIITVVSPFIVSWVSGLIKNHALSDDASKAMVRAVVLALSVAGALLTGWATGTLPDNFPTLLQTAALALVNFIGATGVYHITSGA